MICKICRHPEYGSFQPTLVAYLPLFQMNRFLAIVLLSILWVRSTKIGFLQINIAILCTILFAPHFHGHDLLILLVPSIGVAYILSQKNLLEMKYATLIPLAVSVLLIIGDIGTWIFVVYLVIFALMLLSWRPELLFRSLHIQTG